jgi:hypothetical protein
MRMVEIMAKVVDFGGPKNGHGNGHGPREPFAPTGRTPRAHRRINATVRSAAGVA